MKRGILLEFTGKVHIGSPALKTMEYIMLFLGDLRVIVFGYSGESKVNCSVSYFKVKSQVVDGPGMIASILFAVIVPLCQWCGWRLWQQSARFESSLHIYEG